MANSLLENLSAAAALSGSDLFYVKQGGARGLKATGTQLLTLVGTAYVPLAGGTMTGALMMPAGTKTAPSLTFNGDTAVGFFHQGSSSLMVAGNGRALFGFLQQGQFATTSIGFSISATGNDYNSVGVTTNLGNEGEVNAVGLYGIGTSTGLQQTLRIYSLRNGPTTNYERLALSGVAGSSVNITAETLGTGGDNLDIVLTPAGTGSVKFPGGAFATPAIVLGPTVTGLYANSSGQLNLLSDSVVMFSCEQPTNGVRIASAYPMGWSSSGGANSNAIDAGFARNAAGVVEVNSGTINAYRDLKLRNLLAGGGNGSYVQTPSMTVANLAAAATAGAGARAFVTDANATTYLSTVAGGGANKVPVVSDGTNWLIG